MLFWMKSYCIYFCFPTKRLDYYSVFLEYEGEWIVLNDFATILQKETIFHRQEVATLIFLTFKNEGCS